MSPKLMYLQFIIKKLFKLNTYVTASIATFLNEE